MILCVVHWWYIFSRFNIISFDVFTEQTLLVRSLIIASDDILHVDKGDVLRSILADLPHEVE